MYGSDGQKGLSNFEVSSPKEQFKIGKMTFRTTFPFRTPKSEGVRNGLHDGKQDVRKGWYETSFTR